MQFIVYEKTIVDPVHNTKFKKFLCKYKEKSFDCQFSHEARNTLEQDMTANNLKFPVLLDLDDNNYFVKKVDYTTKSGEQRQKARVVILGYDKISQHEFKSASIDDVLYEIYKTEIEK